jgi:opacity protein-like surface antigen
MKKIVFMAAMVFAATGAEAADLARAPTTPGAPSSYVASAFDGLYVGGNAGYGFSKFDFNASDFSRQCR